MYSTLLHNIDILIYKFFYLSDFYFQIIKMLKLPSFFYKLENKEKKAVTEYVNSEVERNKLFGE